MKRAVALVGVLILGAMSGGAITAGADTPKKVSATKYAKTLCKNYTAVAKANKNFAESYNVLPINDPSTFQTATLALGDQLLATYNTAVTQLSAIYPNTSGGKANAATFTKKIQGNQSDLTDAFADLRAADPMSAGFTGANLGFNTTINLTLGSLNGLSDPFSSVTNSDLLKTFQQVKACKKVVTISGG